jgi:choline kinase
MKVKVRRGRVVEMSKAIAPDEADGENVGVVKFGASGAGLLTTILDERVAAGGLRDWAPRAFAEFAGTRALHAVGTRGLPWTEIDFPEDYRRAVDEILPAIEGDLATRVARLRVETRSRAGVSRMPLGAGDGARFPPDAVPVSPAAGE